MEVKIQTFGEESQECARIAWQLGFWMSPAHCGGHAFLEGQVQGKKEGA